jgi:hypothetical protein
LFPAWTLCSKLCVGNCEELGIRHRPAQFCARKLQEHCAVRTGLENFGRKNFCDSFVLAVHASIFVPKFLTLVPTENFHTPSGSFMKTCGCAKLHILQVLLLPWSPLEIEMRFHSAAVTYQRRGDWYAGAALTGADCRNATSAGRIANKMERHSLCAIRYSSQSNVCVCLLSVGAYSCGVG